MRGAGTTTEQMRNAPKHAIYVWCNDNIDYPTRLAQSLCRNDLVVVRLSWLTTEHVRGLSTVHVVVDHAAMLDEDAQRALHYLKWRYEYDHDLT